MGRWCGSLSTLNPIPTNEITFWESQLRLLESPFQLLITEARTLLSLKPEFLRCCSGLGLRVKKGAGFKV